LLWWFISGLLYAQGIDRGMKSTNQNERKVALVIGNGAYAESPLKNPVSDANAFAGILKTLGFEVALHTNQSQVEMKKAIQAFGSSIASGGVGLFYYAGHGMQVKGNNYLIPVSANIQKEQDVEYEGVDVGRVLAEMESAHNRMNIVILDACRNNPYARSFRSAANGLAQTQAPTGTFIAYATAPGSVAADGNGQNGLYTQELLKMLNQPCSRIEDVFKNVRAQVVAQSGGAQTPWENSSIIGDFYFRQDDCSNTTMTQVVYVDRPSTVTTGIDQEQRILNTVGYNGSNTQATMKRAIEKNNLEAIRILLRKGIDLEATDGNGITPLFLAVGNNNVEAAKLLIENGAEVTGSITVTNDHEMWKEYKLRGYNYTPLHLACVNGFLGMAELLIAKGANVNAVETSTVENATGKSLVTPIKLDVTELTIKRLDSFCLQAIEQKRSYLAQNPDFLDKYSDMLKYLISKGVTSTPRVNKVIVSYYTATISPFKRTMKEILSDMAKFSPEKFGPIYSEFFAKGK